MRRKECPTGGICVADENVVLALAAMRDALARKGVGLKFVPGRQG